MSNCSLKLLITGGKGQLASALGHHPFASQHVLIPCSSQTLDITNPASIDQAITQFKPDVIINTAAYTAVDQAELEPELARRINAEGAKHLAMACQKNQIPLIHLSTDYIFDGTQQTPYLEEDLPHPINQYGKSKWEGEEAIRTHCENHLILRVSGIFSEFGNNFLKTMLRLAKEKKEWQVVTDQISCPTYAGDIAGVIFSLLDNPCLGTFHYCSANPVSWHQFATAIIEHGREYFPLMVEKILPITSAAYQSPAKRPAHSVLDCTKLFLQAGTVQPSWENGIAQALKGIECDG